MQLFSVNTKLSFLPNYITCYLLKAVRIILTHHQPTYRQSKFFLSLQLCMLVLCVSCKATKRNDCYIYKHTQKKATEIHLSRTRPSFKHMDLPAWWKKLSLGAGLLVLLAWHQVYSSYQTTQQLWHLSPAISGDFLSYRNKCDVFWWCNYNHSIEHNGRTNYTIIHVLLKK